MSSSRQFLMMRARGLSGPVLSPHASIPGLSKSAGNFNGKAFNPAMLFQDGSAGAWYDIGQSGSTFSDSAGTIPAIAGNTIGFVSDLSGRGNHCVQSSAPNRPTLDTSGGQSGLLFNGTSGYMQSASAIFNGPTGCTVCVAADMPASITALTVGLFATNAAQAARTATVDLSTGFFYTASGGKSATISCTPYLGKKVVFTTRGNASLTDAWINTVMGTPVASDVPLLSAGPMFLGAFSSTQFFFAGKIYGVCLVGKWLSDADTRKLIAWMYQRYGMSS